MSELAGRVAIIGAGWAGMAAAVEVFKRGLSATVFEASRAIGGRARRINANLPDGSPVVLDNGQHILIGAYSETLRLMQQVGIDPKSALLRLPMALKFPDERGLQFPDWPAPLNALAAILGAQGWGIGDKAALLRAATGWRMARFQCPNDQTVANLCLGVGKRAMDELIEPLCVSALNTPADRASGQVFLTVMRDSLFGPRGSSDLLLPRLDLSDLFPTAAARFITGQTAPRGISNGAKPAAIHLGQRVEALQPEPENGAWQVNGERFDNVILATPVADAIRLLNGVRVVGSPQLDNQLQRWLGGAQTLQFEAITTVYAWASGAKLARPMLALHSDNGSPGAHPCPAQFVFDRGQLGGPAGLLAFVVSASTLARDVVQAQTLAQAQQAFGLSLTAVQTVVEKRATFACTPGLQRPGLQIAPGLLACGDYIAGPYPATLEGAVRSGVAAALAAAGRAE